MDMQHRISEYCRQRPKISVSLGFLLALIVGTGGAVAYTHNTFAKKDFVEQEVDSRVKTVETNIQDLKEDVAYIKKEMQKQALIRRIQLLEERISVLEVRRENTSLSKENKRKLRLMKSKRERLLISLEKREEDSLSSFVPVEDLKEDK